MDWLMDTTMSQSMDQLMDCPMDSTKVPNKNPVRDNGSLALHDAVQIGLIGVVKTRCIYYMTRIPRIMMD